MNKNQIIESIKRRKSFLCVGLDPGDVTMLPPHLRESMIKTLRDLVEGKTDWPKGASSPILMFNQAIIDATAEYCIAYKPNTAFYEKWGSIGWEMLDITLQYIKDNYPDKFVIADGKRGDIGNTSAEYEEAFFEGMDFDALTVAPYMGEDSVKPFLKRDDKWVALLALTSNSGSQDFQMMEDKNGERLFERVIRISQTWAGDDKMMYVVGATQGKLIEDVRRIAPKHFLLVPGVGAQGGSLEEVCRYGMTDECGLIVNVSRAIIYADKTERFAEKAAEVARGIQQQMETLLAQKGII